MVSEHTWPGDYDLRQEFFSNYSKYFNTITENRHELDYGSYGLIVSDDNRHTPKTKLSEIYNSKNCIMIGCYHGAGEKWNNFEFIQKSFGVVLDYCFVMGKSDVNSNISIPIGIPSNDYLKLYQDRDKKHILVIINFLGCNSECPFKIKLDENFVKELDFNSLQKRFKLPIIFKLKSRGTQLGGDEYNKNMEYLNSILPTNLNYKILYDCKDIDTLVAESKLVISAISTLSYKPIQLGIPTVLIKNSGQLGNFGEFRGLVELDKEKVKNKIDEMVENPKDVDFIENTVEGGINFNSTDIFLNEIRSILYGTDETLPVRYFKKEININLFEEFFKKCGKYPGKEKTNSEISGVWDRVVSRWTTSNVNVFDIMEEENLIKLKEIYENYYVDGISEGASSGKALEDEVYRSSKSKRNIDRVKPLQEYLGIKPPEPNNFISAHEVYNILNKKLTIPESINIGQSWGWWYGDVFVNFELADYIYFSDIVIKILDECKLDKTFFLGDGSGLLSTLVYNNYKVKSSYHVDLGHFLLRQYLNNYNNTAEIDYHYAEDFRTDFIHNSEILINQDSFPEITPESVEKYIENARLNNVSYILSYNKEVTFEGGYTHTDFRTIIINNGYTSKRRFESIVRSSYVIELFEFNNIK
jgi:hypothetical protein